MDIRVEQGLVFSDKKFNLTLAMSPTYHSNYAGIL